MQNIRDNLTEKVRFVRILIIIFYCVGIFGIAIPTSRQLFVSLIPLALLLSFFIIIIYHQPENLTKEIFLFIFIFVAAFLIEAIGVRTGRIFGNYSYGEGLGIKLLETPLLIGVNWVLLVWCTAIIADRFKINIIFKIIASSIIMVLYDVILELVAPVIDMWKFDGGVPPLRNYTSWFLLAVIFHSLVRLAGIKPVNTIAPFVLYIQSGFFMILLIIFKLGG